MLPHDLVTNETPKLVSKVEQSPLDDELGDGAVVDGKVLHTATPTLPLKSFIVITGRPLMRSGVSASQDVNIIVLLMFALLTL